VAVHDEVLQASRRLCRERGDWTFRPDEVVRALPHLNASTVRTHIVSRCCVNAPRNHPHRWGYFRRVGRGAYLILPPHRRAATRGVREGTPSYDIRPAGHRARQGGRPRDIVHVVVTRDAGWYIAEGLEIAVVTQGRSLDELVTNVRDAVALHLGGGEAAALGMVETPRIAFTYEVAPRGR
jgi:hypothetical protein